MFAYPEAPASGEDYVEIGPPPYRRRSDCNICRQEDGMKTGSELLISVGRAGSSSGPLL